MKFKTSFIPFFGFFLFLTLALSSQTLEETAQPVLSLESLAEEAKTLREETNWFFTTISAFLVFFMQAGFAYVEAGFTRSKNVVNILMKNFLDLSIGGIGFWLFGFSLMFGTQIFPGIGFGFPQLADDLISTSGEKAGWGYTFFLFQMVFSATAATIVSGAMAERTKFYAYLIISLFMTLLIYPVFGSFAWGGLWASTGTGFLEDMGFHDFAGSTVVHSIGAWGGLAGAIVLRPRIGKYLPGGKVSPIVGHNMSMAALGVFILWFGWFGFNPGSATMVDGGDFARIAVMTQMAAGAGATAAMLMSWLLHKSPDIGFTLNGALAGLVAITAGCDVMSIFGSVLTGALAGILVVLSVLFFDWIHVDDPVGAVSVHGVCGAWGTIAVGLFNLEGGLFYGGDFSQLITQAIGVGIGFLWAFPVALVMIWILHKIVGIRVSEDEELMGLDLLEHGNIAYHDSK